MKQPDLTNETVSKIVDSAVSLFNIYGYAGTSISSVAKKAEVAKGSLYYYFENKDELYLYCSRMCIEKYMSYLDEHIQNPTCELQAIAENIKIRIQFFETYPEYRTLFNYIISRKPNHLSEELIEIRLKLAESNIQQLKKITSSMEFGKGVTEKDIVAFINLLQNNVSFLLQDDLGEEKKQEQIEIVLHLCKIFINGLKADVE